jgi:hypothetical protein
MMGIEIKRPPREDGKSSSFTWRPTLQTWLVLALIAAFIVCFMFTIPSLSHAAILH